MNDPFWLIERAIDGVPHWWKREVGQYTDAMSLDRWTTAASEARHYPSRAEAEFVMGRQMPGCVATEHLMMAKPSPDAGQIVNLTKPDENWLREQIAEHLDDMENADRD